MSFWDVNFFFGDDKLEQDPVGRSYHGDIKPQELPDLNEEPNFQSCNANRIPDLNEDPCVESFYNYENSKNLDGKVSLHTGMKVCMKKMMYIQNHKIAGMIILTGAVMLKCFEIPIRDIYNTQRKIKNEKKAGTTPMRVLKTYCILRVIL
ncbi:hypothetical protein R6Q59_023988 [Mikania micrantha]